MTKKESDYRKLNTEHEKAQTNKEKMTEKLKRYEAKMKDMVDERVGDVIKEKDEAVRIANEIKEENSESVNSIDKLKR